MRVLIYLLSFLFLFLSDCLAYDWIPLAFDTEDAINIAVQKEVGKKKDYDSAAFKKSSIVNAQNEVNEKNRAVDQNLIKLRNNYNRKKNKRDTQKTLYDDVKNRFDKEEVKYKTAIENINKYKSQKETYKKEISLQQANLTKRLANEPVGEVVTIALYSTGWKEKKSSQEKKADILATESAIEIMMTYIDSSSMVKNNILVKDTIISRKSGQAESIKQPLEQKLAAGKYLRIRSFRLYPLKKSIQRSDMDFKKQKIKALSVLDSEMLKRFINENKIVVSDNFLKRANTLVNESRRTTIEDQKNLDNIITSQIRIISNKKDDLQDVIESIKHHKSLKKRSQENMNRLSTELKNEKARLQKQAATLKKTETAYFNAKNAFTHYVFKKPRGQIKRDEAPPEIAADILISTLHEVRDDSRRYYSDIFEQTNMGMLSIAKKGSEQVSIKITKFKLTYITESATSDDMEIGAIFEVTMGKMPKKKTQLAASTRPKGNSLTEQTYSSNKKVKSQDAAINLFDVLLPIFLLSIFLLAMIWFMIMEKRNKRAFNLKQDMFEKHIKQTELTNSGKCEVSAWRKINTTNSLWDYEKYLEEYLKEYPDGSYKKTAQRSLKILRKRRELGSNRLRRMVYLFFYYLIPAIAVFIISSNISFISYLRDMNSNAWWIPSIITSFCIVSSSTFFELVLFKQGPLRGGLIKKLFKTIVVIIYALFVYSACAGCFILALIFLLNVFDILITNLTLSLSIATIVVIPFCSLLHFLMTDLFEKW